MSDTRARTEISVFCEKVRNSSQKFLEFALALVFLLVLEEINFISSPFGRSNLGYLQGKLIGFTAQ